MKTIAQQIYLTAIEEFKEICKYPHLSNDQCPPPKDNDSLKLLKDYLLKRIKTLGGKNISTDLAGNIWFDIPASKGWEKKDKFVLQGHMDMIWDVQKEALKWDGYTHPISEPIIEKVNGEEVMHSKDYLTTLGADDGIALAVCLSLLKHQKSFKHSLIRCIFTVNEENGCYGAQQLGILSKTKRIKVFDVNEGFKYFINMDYAEEGAIVASSASVDVKQQTINKLTKTTVNSEIYSLEIQGLLGGHSGVYINGRANAIKLLSYMLESICDDSLKLSSWTTGSKEFGKIHTQSMCYFASNKSSVEIKKILDDCLERYKNQYPVEKKVTYILNKEPKKEYYLLNNIDSKHIIDFVDALWFGVVSRFTDDLAVESSANVGPVTLNLHDEHNQFVCDYFIRAASDKLTKLIEGYNDKMFDTHLAANFGSNNTTNKTLCAFKPFEYKPNNQLIKMFEDAYKQNNIKSFIFKCHGGLECSHLSVLEPDIYMVSVGPKLVDEHLFTETLHLKEFYNLCAVVLNVLGQVK